MYQDSKRTCTAIVLLIKSFVWCRSRRRRRLGLLKLPTNSHLRRKQILPKSTFHFHSGKR